jgi:hypothetical protein
MVSLDKAFAAHGVDLKFPERSRSGIRADDGCVVIAIRDCDVHACLDGFICLLYAPAVDCNREILDRPSWQERLEHCRLAALRGGAEGLLMCGDAGVVEPRLLLTLRVEKRKSQFWAMWGSAARATGLAFSRPASPLHQTASLAA